MIYAEINGKLTLEYENDQETTPIEITRMEDVLTSNVFGILKCIDQGVIRTLLREAGIHVDDQEVEFVFWHSFDDRTEPDLILHVGDISIIVEVKYLSDFDKGNSNKSPQIIRELTGALNEFPDQDIYFLAVTREENISWTSKVFTSRENHDELNRWNGKLKQFSWKDIYKLVTEESLSDNYDIVTKRFLRDLQSFLEKKEIGYIPATMPEDGYPFEHYFGAESENLVSFIREHGHAEGNEIRVILSDLQLDEQERLYEKIKELINIHIRNNRLAQVTNSIDTAKIPLDLLLSRNNDELIGWVSFFTFLYTNNFVNVNGLNNISVRLRFVRGNHTGSLISLFTYYRQQDLMKFLINRGRRETENP